MSEIDLQFILSTISSGRSAIVGEGQQARIVNYLRLTPGRGLNEKAVRTALKARLPNIMIPSGFVVLSAFPLCCNKIDIRRLPAPETPLLGFRSGLPCGQRGGKPCGISGSKSCRRRRSARLRRFLSALGGNSLQIPQLLRHSSTDGRLADYPRIHHAQPDRELTALALA
ncbi:hypothetical protein M8494_20240 [Serratia ureilytica]